MLMKALMGRASLDSIDHCRRANKREQPLVDFVVKSRLDKQTIF